MFTCLSSFIFHRALPFFIDNICQFLSRKSGKAIFNLILDRCSARPSGLQIQTTESSGIAEVQTTEVEVEPGQTEQDECLLSNMKTLTRSSGFEILPSDNSPDSKVSSTYDCETSAGLNSEVKIEQFGDMGMINIDSTGIANEISSCAVESTSVSFSQTVNDLGDIDITDRSFEETSGCMEEQDNTDMVRSSDPSPGSPNDSFFDKHSSVSRDHRNMEEDFEHIAVVKDNTYYGNGYVSSNESSIPIEDGDKEISGIGSSH